MTAEERTELRMVLKALHRNAMEWPREDQAPEERDRLYATPRFHDQAELWERALAITEPDERDQAFETAWRALVNRARAFLAETVEQ